MYIHTENQVPLEPELDLPTMPTPTVGESGLSEEGGAGGSNGDEEWGEVPGVTDVSLEQLGLLGMCLPCAASYAMLVYRHMT